jgi:GntR family transcriptional regulator, rspAB operon transcriptional repressor
MKKNPFSNVSRGFPEELSSPHVPASSRVYAELRSRIVSLDLPPDAPLARAEIAERFSVSQSPVREAIMRLELDGLVVSYPQSRTIVARIDIARVREEHFLRTAVECDVVRELADRLDPAPIRRAKGILKMQGAIVDDSEQIELFRQLDDAFHESLFAAIGQSGLYQHVSARCGHLDRVRQLDLPGSGNTKSVLDGHQEVVVAMEDGKPEKAADSMKTHLAKTIERLPNVFRENRLMFL